MRAECIRRVLNSLQTIILVEQWGQNKFAVPSQTLSDAKQIYRSVGLCWNEMLFARQLETVRQQLMSV